MLQSTGVLKNRVKTPSTRKSKTVQSKSGLLKFGLVGLSGALASLAVATLVLYVLVIHGSNNQLSANVYQSHAKSYADFFDQRFAQLSAQVKHLSLQNSIAQAFSSGGDAALDRAARSAVEYIPNLISLKLLPIGVASLNPEKYQLSFPLIDMVNRAERGEIPPAEVHDYLDRKALHMVYPVQQSGKTLGVVLASFKLNLLSDQSGIFQPDNGSMRLEQVYQNGKPQVIVPIGPEFNEGQPILELGLENSYFRVRFQPSEKLAGETVVSPLGFWAPLAFAFFAVAASIIISYLNLRKTIREDAAMLGSYCRALIVGRSQKPPAFSLDLFESLAQTLSNTGDEVLLLDDTEEQETPVDVVVEAQAEPIGAGMPPMHSTELGVEELDDEADDYDIPDFDLLDMELATGEPPDKASDNDPSDLVPLDLEPLEMKKPFREVPSEIFRAYDIRGIVGQTLDTDIAYRIGQSIGSEAAAKNNQTVAVGADGRLSSPELSAALIQGLRDSGRNVINLGMVPTPLAYYATHHTEAESAVMITGSHNPPDYNGFKIVIDGQTLANEQIQSLYTRIANSDFTTGQGSNERTNIAQHYIDHIIGDVVLARPMKVVIDCGNGVAGAIAPKLFEALNCEVIPLYCEVDGHFPNHHPDPSKEENLVDLKAAIAEHQADLGLAFDGDGDRVGIVTNAGNMIYPDRLLMVLAKDVVSRNPGAEIIYDVKCSRRLDGLISNYGGRAIMWKTGHSLIKAKMKETGALLAGEMSGHIFFKERWFGFDDGLYSAARLLEILSADSRDADSIFAAFPDDISTPELNIEVTEERKFDIIDQLQASAKFDDGEIISIDGIRVNFKDGWGLIRASNTTPMLVLRFAAENEEALDRIRNNFKVQLLAVAPDLQIPF